MIINSVVRSSFFYLCTFAFVITNHSFAVLNFSIFKHPTLGSFTPAAFQELQSLFHADVFIESGTLHGDTTVCAVPYFKEIHSIELMPNFYFAALPKLSPYTNIALHLGDSAAVLPQILPYVKGKILFWLDGHIGSSTTPLLRELAVIKQAGLKDSIILIDDLRECIPPCWPSLHEVVKAVLQVNPEYQLVVFGDILFAYPPSENVIPSAFLKACTTSRLYDENLGIDINDVFTAEINNIASVQGSELSALAKLSSTFVNGPHYKLWYALALARQQDFNSAINLLLETKKQLPHWRVSWYIAQTAHMGGNNNLAKQYAYEVLAKNNSFQQARDLLAQLS